MKLKILIISYYFPPLGLSGVQRVAKFVKYLCDEGFDITVIAPEKVAYFAYDDSLEKELIEKNVKIIRVKGNEPHSFLSNKNPIKMPSEFWRKLFNRLSQTFFLPDNKKSWSKKAYYEAQKILSKEQFDIIFSSAPPFSMFSYVAKLGKEFNLPVALDYRDLFYQNQFSFYPTPFHRLYIKFYEKKYLKNVERIFVINRQIKEFLLTTYPFLDFNKIYILPHGYDPEDFEKVNLQKKIKNLLDNDDKIIVTYCGIFYEFITPKYFLKAYKKLLDTKPEIAGKIHLRFVGHLNKTNINIIKTLKLFDKVEIVEYVEHNKAIEYLLESDVLWLMVGKSKNSHTISTSKLYEYIASRKPIIGCVVDGAAKQALKEYGCSIIVDPYDIDAIQKVFEKILLMTKKKLFPQPNENFIQSCDRKKLTSQLAIELRKLVFKNLA